MGLPVVWCWQNAAIPTCLAGLPCSEKGRDSRALLHTNGLPRGKSSETVVPTCRDNKWGTAVHTHAPRAAPPGESTEHTKYSYVKKATSPGERVQLGRSP